MSGNSYLDLLCSNLDSYYALTDYSWPETPGATSQAGVYDCSNGAGAPSSNTRSDESRMPYSVADGTSSHSGVTLFHQEQPYIHSFPCIDADNPLLTGELSRRPEEKSEDAHAPDPIKVKKTKKLSKRQKSIQCTPVAEEFTAKLVEIKSVRVNLRLSKCDFELVKDDSKIGGFSSYESLVKHRINLYWADKYGEQLIELTPGKPGGRAQPAAVRSETRTAQTQEEYAAGNKKSETIRVNFSHEELESIDKEVKIERYLVRSEFIRYCVNRYRPEKYPKTSVLLPIEMSAAEQEENESLKQQIEVLKKENKMAREGFNDLQEKIHELEEKNKALMDCIVTSKYPNRSNSFLTYGAHSDLPQYIGCYDPAADKMSEDAQAGLDEVQKRVQEKMNS